MSKYVEYYNKAVDLYKAGHHDLTPELIYGSEFYSTRDRKILESVAYEVLQKGHNLAVKYHPTWLFVLRSGGSEQRCLEAWRNDDPDMKYLDELTHIESEKDLT